MSDDTRMRIPMPGGKLLIDPIESGNWAGIRIQVKNGDRQSGFEYTWPIGVGAQPIVIVNSLETISQLLRKLAITIEHEIREQP